MSDNKEQELSIRILKILEPEMKVSSDGNSRAYGVLFDDNERAVRSVIFDINEPRDIQKVQYENKISLFYQKETSTWSASLDSESLNFSMHEENPNIAIAQCYLMMKAKNV